MVRIAFLAPDVELSRLNGDVWHVKDLAFALARAGTEVDLFVAEKADWKGPENARVHEIPIGGLLHATFKAWNELRTRSFDIFYERRESPKLSAVLSRLLHRPYVVEINGLTEEEKAMQGRPLSSPAWIRNVKVAIRAWLLRGAAGIVCVTEGLQESIASLYDVPRERITVIPNGVDLQLFRPLPMDKSRQDLGLDPSQPCLVFVGTLVAWQGVHVLIEAIDRIRREFPLVSLHVVGDGIERSRLDRITSDCGLQDRVRFVGQVPRQVVPIWIAAADIAVMPATIQRNRRIGSSALKLREYLACGRPVVATDLPGVRALLGTSECGLAVEGDNPEELARAIAELLRDRHRREAMGARARELAERELSWDLVARRVLEFLGRFSSAPEG